MSFPEVPTSTSQPSPAILFEVDLTLKSNSYMGPTTNQVLNANHHPDRFSEDQDAAIASIDNRKNYINSNVSEYFNSGLTVGESSLNVLSNIRKLKHGDRFTLYGKKAIEVRNKYALGYATNSEDVILKVIS